MSQLVQIDNEAIVILGEDQKLAKLVIQLLESRYSMNWSFSWDGMALRWSNSERMSCEAKNVSELGITSYVAGIRDCYENSLVK